jgi:hypothetical protein
MARPKGRTRILLVLGLLAAALSAGAAPAAADLRLPAWATTAPAPHGTLVPARMARRRTASDWASVQLSTVGRRLRIHGVTNWASLDAYRPAGRGSPTDAEVFVARGSRAHSQFNDYRWDTARPIAFHVDRRTLTATLDTGSAWRPSRIALTFTPGVIHTHTCALHGGGTGVYKQTRGTLTISTFRIATTTRPFFGTFSIHPTAAVVDVDPGCQYHGGLQDHRCPASEVINAPGPAKSEWDGVVNLPGTKAWIGSVEPQTRPVRNQFSHWTQDVVPVSDLPPPTAGPDCARAVLHTTGAKFASGTGVFTSTSKPETSTGSCVLAGVTRTYSEKVYKGVLSPGADPLTALLDVGPLSLAPNTRAELALGSLTG